jgi:hypothetical protein
MVDALGGIGPRYWRGIVARHKAEAWLIEDIRVGSRQAPEGSALSAIAAMKGPQRALAPESLAALTFSMRRGRLVWPWTRLAPDDVSAPCGDGSPRAEAGLLPQDGAGPKPCRFSRGRGTTVMDSDYPVALKCRATPSHGLQTCPGARPRPGLFAVRKRTVLGRNAATARTVIIQKTSLLPST